MSLALDLQVAECTAARSNTFCLPHLESLYSLCADLRLGCIWTSPTRQQMSLVNKFRSGLKGVKVNELYGYTKNFQQEHMPMSQLP